MTGGTSDGTKQTIKDSDQANNLRLVAAEIIYQLWEAGETTQLELLMMQAKRSIEVPFSAESR